VEIPAEFLRDLKAWKLACPKGEHDLCFPQADGGPMHGSALTARGLTPARRRAGIREVRFHDLRHSFASNLLAAGVDVVTVSRFMGHASPRITLTIYSHVIPKQPHGASELLAKLMRESGNKMETEGGQEVAFGPGSEPKSLDLLEASAGIEPAYTDLQSAA
jgi:integrase